MKTKLIIGVLLLSAALLILPAAADDSSAPVLPLQVYGTVSYTDGGNLPAGTVITATVDGVTSTYTVTQAGKIGGAGTFDEKFLINGTTNGSTVTFKINGLPAEVAGGCTFTSGDAKQIALTTEKKEETVSPTPASTCTVTFDAAGGTPAPAAQTVETGKCAVEPTKPEKDGYDFDGWLKDGEKYNFATPVTGNITLIAKWVVVVPSDETEIKKALEEIKESKEVITVQVNEDNKAAVEKLVGEAQKEGVADQVTLDVVDTDSAEVVKEIIDDVGKKEQPVSVNVTGENKELVEDIISDAETAAKVNLPVKDDGTNIDSILTLSETQPAVNVSVPAEITLVKETVVSMVTDDPKDTKLEITEGVIKGKSTDKFALDLESNPASVKNTVDLLGKLSSGAETITVKNQPENVTISQKPSEDKHDLNAKDEGVSALAITGMNGITAAAVSKNADKLLENEGVTIPDVPVTSGYKDQKIHSVFQIVVPETRTAAVTVTFEVTLKDGEDASKLSSFYLKHYKGNGWEAGHISQSANPAAVAGKANTWTLKFRMTEFSPFALVSETALSESSSPSSGSTPTRTNTDQVTSTPTPVPTVPTTEPTTAPVSEVPTVKPSVQPVETPQAKSPAPIFGILAGLGAAAAVFGFRRK